LIRLCKQFNSGWPIQVTTSFADSLLNSSGTSLSALKTPNSPAQNDLSQFVGSTDTDNEHINGLSGMPSGPDKKVYMGAVSPWFFTHYSPQTYNKNVSGRCYGGNIFNNGFIVQFIYLSDEHLYAKRWESIIASRDKFDLVEIVTWNDYGESHYIGPIKGDQPNSQAWVNGLNHTGKQATFSFVF